MRSTMTSVAGSRQTRKAVRADYQKSRRRQRRRLLQGAAREAAKKLAPVLVAAAREEAVLGTGYSDWIECYVNYQSTGYREQGALAKLLRRHLTNEACKSEGVLHGDVRFGVRRDPGSPQLDGRERWYLCLTLNV